MVNSLHSNGTGERQVPVEESPDSPRRTGAESVVQDAEALRSLPVPAAGHSFLDKLVDLRLLTPGQVQEFLEQRLSRLGLYTTPEALGQDLVQAGLLTEYQFNRVQAGTTHGLVLGSYRMLKRLGAGGMGIVFLAEHYLMKRQVAVKVLPIDEDCSAAVRERFYGEMRVLADLHHPHIVLAFDAGELPSVGPNMPGLVYLVMEVVSGGDLEEYVMDRGPLPVAQACEWVRQAACGLQEAHDRHLIHRDVKPSNLLLTARQQVKVVDFGLARQFCSRLTDPHALLGSVEFMPPEQSHDPSAVGAEADIYGLGATLFWLLAGQPPYLVTRSLRDALRALQNERPRRLRDLRPDVPAELDELIDRMLDRDLKRRPAMPLTVMNALLPFTDTGSGLLGTQRRPRPRRPRQEVKDAKPRRVLDRGR